MITEMVSVPKDLLNDLLADPQAETSRVAFARIKARALLEACDGAEPPALNEAELDRQMTEAGMLTVGEMLAGAPLDGFIRHAGVVGVETFAAWLEIRRKECLTMKARMELRGEVEHEDYAWVMSHAAVLSELHINFKPVTAEFAALRSLLQSPPAESEAVDAERHSDDRHVDRFAELLKSKLAKSRSKGRGGWDDPEQCTVEFLAELLVGHLSKGNEGTFEDVATFAMMLHARGADPIVLARAVEQAKCIAADRPSSVLDGLAKSLERFVDAAEEMGSQAGSPSTMQLMTLMSALAHGKEVLRAYYAGKPLAQEIADARH